MKYKTSGKTKKVHQDVDPSVMLTSAITTALTTITKAVVVAVQDALIKSNTQTLISQSYPVAEALIIPSDQSTILKAADVVENPNKVIDLVDDDESQCKKSSKKRTFSDSLVQINWEKSYNVITTQRFQNGTKKVTEPGNVPEPVKKTLACPHCKKQVGNEGALTKHINAKHQPSKPVVHNSVKNYFVAIPKETLKEPTNAETVFAESFEIKMIGSKRRTIWMLGRAMRVLNMF